MWTKENIPDQSGKISIVTGANTGIGFETALALSQAGATVIIAGRDSGRVNEAVYKINNLGGKISGEILDLVSIDAVKRFSEEIKNKYDRLDLLINNAGVMIPPAGTTADGYELQFGINFLGHFALTGHLYPLLNITPGARVVTVSSGAHRFVDGVDLENVRLQKGYDAYREYAVSKLANLQFVIELQKRLSQMGSDLLSVGAHPGVTETELSRHMPQADYKAAVERFSHLMPAWQGALPSLYAAVSPDVKGGGYYGPDGEGELHGYPAPAKITEAVADEKLGKELWNFAENATGLRYPM
ncbi:oxidoreductase [Mucilaginibacter sp. CAU 1740]|uniref:oxidoreductase n=1 Tax=Mucilaginibacter sp. CAU 1740 TaxID=3140365 RepID=UPI00325BEDCB